MCSASSPVITSTLSNRTFSTGLEIQADVDSISVVFLNKAVSVGEKKKGNPFCKRNIYSTYNGPWLPYSLCLVSLNAINKLLAKAADRREKGWNTAKCHIYLGLFLIE